MKRRFIQISLLLTCLARVLTPFAQQSNSITYLEKIFTNPPASAKPWVFWYWMHAAISKEGIKADLEAMKEAGIGGAYLMPIKDTSSRIPFQPTARQLSPEWWALVKFAMQEAKRLNLQLAMHVSDGFALAGGPWIKPELSMQKLVWTKTWMKTGDNGIKLSHPETKENYYKDIAVLAYPANTPNDPNDGTMIPLVITSNGSQAGFLPVAGAKGSFRSDSSCWIQYQYPRPFTGRSVRIFVGGNNYQAQRFIIQTSDDGVNFKTITRLEPPRHGWQDTDEDYTYAIPAATARYFRFVYDKTGSEPGSEDLDAAKWKPSLKVNGIYLSEEPIIHQYETKNGSVWRVATNTTQEQVTDKDAVPLKSIINLTGKMDKDGNLNWTAPPGNWIVVRVGHTSTGHTNYTGGAGLGLECDKFNAAAVQLQFDNWFAKAFEKTDPVLAKEVLKVFHVDSWECGSQNWSPVFAAEFQKRRGYDLMPYLLTMAGVPIESAAVSEKVLHDVRQTIADLVNDVFYVTLNKLAHEKGSSFSAEAIAPTMVSDGLRHYKQVDLPMGEFWLNSPTHDKPNDMLDAISGAHIYGKNIIQAESFTSIRMNWGEHPGNLKVVGDRNFALGINKMVLHVFTQNPWLDRKPGMTLDGIGLYYQRDQTWFKQSKAWIDYLTRCSALLQAGKPVVDIAVFTGEEVPRRSILPDRLVTTLPGIFGKERMESEKKRLSNTGEPLRQIPDGVTHSANMADPEDWIDPLRGYTYDSFNPDALMMMSVKNGKVVLPGGASYSILVFPGKHPMQPNNTLLSLTVANKIVQLVKEGATVIMNKDYINGIGLQDKDEKIRTVMNQLFEKNGNKGKIILSPYMDSSFVNAGLQKDVEVMNDDHSIAWSHRRWNGSDIYFISNQTSDSRLAKLSFNISGKMAEVWDPVKLTMTESAGWRIEKGRTIITERLAPNQSVFIIFRKPALKYVHRKWDGPKFPKEHLFYTKWQVEYDTAYGGPVEMQYIDGPELKSWTHSDNESIKYYSGTAVYTNWFMHHDGKVKSAWLEVDSIYNMATVNVNGIDCGTLWTYPYKVDIGKAVKKGTNKVKITVSNTWYNRLIGDSVKPASKRVTWTTAPFRLGNKPLLPSGITGRIKLMMQ